MKTIKFLAAMLVVASVMMSCNGQGKGGVKAELRTDIIIRNRRTRTQTELSAEEKEANVSGAFGINSFSAGGSMEQERISHILLIDDIFTTGSTLYHCFSALRTVFPPPLRISVATLGFAG